MRFGAINTSDDVVKTALKASGSTTINANSQITLSTQTRNANARMMAGSFVTNNVNNLSWGGGASLLQATNAVDLGFERTVNANEFNLVGKNTNLVSSATVEWTIIEITS